MSYKIWDHISSLCLLSIFIGGFILATKTFMASGAIDFCYVEKNYPPMIFELKGHRSWRSDFTIGEFETLGQVVEVAEKLNCPLGKIDL